MSIPSAVNYVPQYLALLPPRGEYIAGTCVECAYLYAMELRGILLGQPVVQLSQLFMYVNGQQLNPGGVVCSEYLWPISMSFGPFLQTAKTAIPTAPCVADAPYHKLMATGPAYDIPTTKAALAAGYPVIALANNGNHEVCIMGYDDSTQQWTGLDPTNGSAVASYWGYPYLGPFMSITDVLFTAQPTTTINLDIPALNTLAAELVWDRVWNMEVPLPLTVTPAWAAQFMAAVGAIGVTMPTAPIVVTQQFAAQVNALVAYITPPPPPPVNPIASPAGTVVPPAAAIIDNSGADWTLSTTTCPGGFQIFRNGAWCAGGGSINIQWDGSKITVLNNANVTYLWTGTGWQRQ